MLAPSNSYVLNLKRATLNVYRNNLMANNSLLMSSQSSFVASTKISSSEPKTSKFLMSNMLPSNIRNSNNNKSYRTNWRKTMTPEKIEIFSSLEGWVESNIMTHLKPVENLWQPQDFLPNPSHSDEEFFESIKGLRERALEMPDEYYVCLVGDMITEEALPTYQSFVYSLFETVCDTNGSNTSSWAKWTRGWTAEENRHGDLLNKYLYLTGRCDMKQIEKTIQYLIRDGMNTVADSNPYLGLIYTSFQERATFISHGNTARQAKQYGDTTLAKICGLIASEEKRHEHAYTKVVEKLFEIDPNTTMLALAHMMKHRITMPAHFMFDGKDENLFNHYSIITQRIGVYTSKDYADIVEFFVKRWNVEKVGGLSSEGRKAQEYVCGLVDRFRKLEERSMKRKRCMKGKNDCTLMPFSWIFNRDVVLN